MTTSTAAVTLLLLEVASATARVKDLVAYPTGQSLSPEQNNAAQAFLMALQLGQLDQMSYALIDLANAFEGETYLFDAQEAQNMQIRFRAGATAILDGLGRK